MRDAVSLLLPRPQRVHATGERVGTRGPVRLVPASREAAKVALGLERTLRALGIDARVADARGEGATIPAVELAVDWPCFGKREHYRLRVAPNDISLLASDEAGLFYGACTLAQLFRLGARDGTVPGLVIRDWPDFPARGVMLDVSRDKVPTLATLFSLVDLLASWKLNQLQLYFEHAFAYRNHEGVWRNASPFTGQEVRELDAYCRERHVELVPNQNSLGHMERWLEHEPYRELAECPDGVELPFSSTRMARCLCPIDPRSLALVSELYDELFSHFQSRQLNVGLDETWELGLGRSAAACRERGTERVYLDYLREVHRRVRARGRTMQFWGDIIVHRPELIDELPGDVIALEWGYEADHPFAEHAAQFASRGQSFYVCPGTSSWNSFAGRTDNAVANLTSAARAGRDAGAVGYLVTDWGDNGHLQPLPVSYLGFMVGAAVSWNAAEAEDPAALEVGARLDAHAFGDASSAMGALAIDLGNAYRQAGAPRANGSALFWLLLRAEDAIPGDLSVNDLESTLAFIERCTSGAARASMTREDAKLVLAEYAWVADVLRFACRLGRDRLAAGGDVPVRGLPTGARQRLATELGALLAEHRELWLPRNREGGLNDSAARLGRLVTLLS